MMHFHLGQTLCQLSICGQALLLGDKEATQLHALLSVCEKSDRCAVTKSRTNLREVASLVTIDAQLLLVSCLCTELAMRLKHYAFAQGSLYSLQLLTLTSVFN